MKSFLNMILLASLALLVACGARRDSADGDRSEQAISTPTLTILDRGAKEGIRVSSTAITFASAASSQRLRIRNTSSFWIEMTGHTSPATFKPADGGQIDEAVFDVGVPGKLKLVAYPGEEVWIDLLPGNGSPTCEAGTTVVSARTTSYYTRGPSALCYPTERWCERQEGPDKLLKVTVESCNLPRSLTARIEGADDQLFIVGKEPFAGSQTFTSDGEGFRGEIHDRYGGVYHQAYLTFGPDGRVATLEAWITRGHQLRHGFLKYDASTCVPKTCSELGAQCGPIDDGCGTRLECGGCQAPAECGAAGLKNQCVEPVHEIATEPDITASAFDSDYVYWSTRSELKRAPVAGGSIETLGPVAGARKIAVDATHVYIATDAELSKMPKQGGALVSLGTLNAKRVWPSGIALDDTHVFVASEDLQRFDKQGGAAPVTLATGQSFAPGIDVYDNHVYFIHRGEWGGTYKTGSVRKVPAGGGQVTEVVQNVAYLSLSLQVNSHGIFWAAYGVMHAPLDGSTAPVSLFSRSDDVELDNDFVHAIVIEGDDVIVAHKELKFLRYPDRKKSVPRTHLTATRVPIAGGAQQTIGRYRISGGEPVQGVYATNSAVFTVFGKTSQYSSATGSVIRYAR